MPQCRFGNAADTRRVPAQQLLFPSRFFEVDMRALLFLSMLTVAPVVWAQDPSPIPPVRIPQPPQGNAIVRFTSPRDNSVVSGTVTIRVAVALPDRTASPRGSRIARVDFAVSSGCGIFLGSDSTSPYEVQWDTRAMAGGRPRWPNGRYTLVAYAWDTQGRRSSASIQVTVNNPISVPPVRR
jgi:hypothetical protein